MNTVSIIKPLNLFSKMGGVKGKLMKPFLFLLLPIWLIGCFVAFLLVLFVEHNAIVGAAAILGLAMGVALIYILNSGGEYKPEKSFFLWRSSKENILKLNKYFTIGGVVLVVLISLVDFKIQNILYLLSALVAYYFVSKSFKMHEDVDYVANSDVSDLLGMEIDEKIQASYQNFDSQSIHDGSNMMLLTDKKLMFAFYDGSKWSLVNKSLGDIRKIGRLNADGAANFTSTSCFLYIVFSDETSVGLHMDLYDKITSNPDLFFKKFLVTLDTFLLGKTDEKIASRRRVSINDDSKPSTKSNEESANVRAIDISNTIVENLRDALPVEAGRVLEF